MKRLTLLTICLLMISDIAGAAEKMSFTFSEAVEFALQNNPGLSASGKEVEIDAYEIKKAEAAKMPRLDFNSAMTRYRYPAPLTPISGNPLAGAVFPEFDCCIYSAGMGFGLALFRGG